MDAIDKSFNRWFNEMEAYGHRFERFYSDLNNWEDPQTIVEWLKAAHTEGYLQARYDTMKLYWDDGK